MNKYESMTNDEINKALAECIKWTTRVFKETNQFAYGEGVNPWSFRMNFNDWNPSYKDSNQLVNYVFPKLFKIGGHAMSGISTCLSAGFFTITIALQVSDRPSYSNISCKCSADAMDKINRTIAEACLEVFDKLKESE